jgi:hypothetical protein
MGGDPHGAALYLIMPNYNMQGKLPVCIRSRALKKDKPQSFYNQLVKLDIEEKSIKNMV